MKTKTNTIKTKIFNMAESSIASFMEGNIVSLEEDEINDFALNLRRLLVLQRWTLTSPIWFYGKQLRSAQITLCTCLLTLLTPMIISMTLSSSFIMWSLEGKDPLDFFMRMARYFAHKLTDFLAQFAVFQVGWILNYTLAAIFFKDRHKIIEFINASSSIVPPRAALTIITPSFI